MAYLLAIDQGTTSSRAIIFNELGEPLSQHQIDLPQSYPQEGWVEQAPEAIWQNTLECCRQSLQKIKISAKDITAVGITNQRETTLIWDKKTGEPIYPAIVWQDRRTVSICNQLSQHSLHEKLCEKTGLLLDPYFSATKIMWLLNTIPTARARAERGELLFGTIDTFLLWRLTKGKVHATDATNASRTLLFNIVTQEWDQELLTMFEIPEKLLPVVLDSSADFGKIDAEFFGHPIAVTSLVGDQQAATVGQACFSPGMVKSTLGTGCFVLLNTGHNVIRSKNQLLATVAYRLNGKVTYGLEGSIFSAGVSIKWLRDKLKIINSADETAALAQSVKNTGGVYLIPAFTGLGAPYWNPEARAALVGLTCNSGIPQIVRAALEAVGYQSRDLLEAMQDDSGLALTTLRVDGGMAANQWLLQFLADILNVEIQTPACRETTARGAAFLAGLQAGIYQSLAEISECWHAKQNFLPQHNYEDLYQGWKKAIAHIG